MPITASVNYHVQSHAPQAFQFDVDGIAGNLISPTLIATEVSVQDLRNSECAVNFTDDGILFVESPTEVVEFSADDRWKTAYNAEITALLKTQISAKEVIVFDHTVRIDTTDATRKPARNVHNDYSRQGADQRLVDLVGEQSAAEFQQGHFGFVNVWRPIEHTITSSPLGFIRPNSMSIQDWMNIELIYPDRKGQILGVSANASHEWFFLSEMTPKEAIVFNIFDNQKRPHLAHSALDVIGGATSTLPRQSIETRTLVRYV